MTLTELDEYFNSFLKKENFSNARCVRNIFEKVKARGIQIQPPSCDLSKKKSFPTLIPEEGVSTKSMDAESSETEQEPVPTFDSLKTNIFIRSTGVKEVYY